MGLGYCLFPLFCFVYAAKICIFAPNFLTNAASRMSHLADIRQLLEPLPSISLEEMKGIRLMQRTDTKFVTDIATLKQLLVLVRGQYYAQVVEGERLNPYTTTYFDSCNYEFFRRHQCGARPRTKVRARVYESSGMCFLEIKRKDNHGKTRKVRTPVPSVKHVLEERAGESFLREQSEWDFDHLHPTLSNRFRRLTLVNLGKTERLTIDFELSFYNHDSATSHKMDEAVIIELKRDGRVPSPILPLLRQLRIKPAGFSKYCVGIATTDTPVPINRYKRRLRRVAKTIHSRT